MKKKRFYNNKKRNKKWTEQEKGRKISFADKYIETDNSSDKYGRTGKKEKKPFFTRIRLNIFAKYFIIALGCFAVISAGYTVMDLYIERNAMPITENSDDVSDDISAVSLQLKSEKIESMSMDGGVMLEAVLDELQKGGFTSVAFDIKRDDGTIGYNSSLATIDMYGAESSFASNAGESINEFIKNDILPVGIIYCYKDNIFAPGDLTAGIKMNGKLYRDNNANAYLNPDSDSVYNYIKSIIEEVKAMGVTVFVLEGCDLPDELGDGYRDGFKPLANRLYSDFGNEIKLIESISVSINSDNTKAIQEEWKEKTDGIDSRNIIFSVSAKNKNKVKKFLDNQDGISYIISE